MLPFRLQPDAGHPAYRQIAGQVRYFITQGLLMQGEALPSVRELARFLALNPGTVVKAYAELEDEGWIETQPGRGAFVCGSGPRRKRRESEAAVRGAAEQFWLAVAPLGLAPARVRELWEAAAPDPETIPPPDV